ncbi:transcriptional regulator [Actinocrispum wychmicini]|uniref:Uncharacterized protein n=1 Tax=Actinocrispum wychmicini TaxID=1213861 RepID=A0A4R2JLW8_9PSEU|nr:transcriptional regulator [Actinocrispum wychmicini]TCO61073.1 hypothetical protein EV192_103657 [Actinocrispum wychmicini]
MSLVDGWTGRSACALQAALRMSNELFAQRLGIAVRTVASWHQKPSLRPKSEIQQILDTTLEQASAAVKERFAALTTDSPSGEQPRADERLDIDPNITAALDWLDHHADRQPGASRRDVASRLAQVDQQDIDERGIRRTHVNQRRVAQALDEYYRDRDSGHGLYGASYGDGRKVTTSVLTRPDWLDLDCPLIATHDRLVLGTTTDHATPLDSEAAGHAAQRLAESLACNVRLTDMPLYRLVNIDVSHGRLAGSVAVTHFVRYALTMDLLEGELIDALATDVPLSPESLPLRAHYLPDVTSVVNVSNRLCAGGTLALCAIARPADPYRGPADYVLLVQERSGHVVNAARRLAVIPKGFHQPLTDYRSDAQIGATLRREMEEEFFGREDIDNTIGDQRRADPMHPSRLSEPMKWLMGAPERLAMECTGFGLNLVSGNFEFASLIVINDDEFWTRFGGDIEANWEASTLRQYSSLDSELLSELIEDDAWSNEGLFALLQGLRRLRQIGGDRVNVPTIEWEMR